MQWKIDGSQPVYMQIISHIRSGVLAGEFPPGSRIPSVRELAAEAKVNPNTMQRAMMELERQGILISNGTIGRFVTEDQNTIEQIRKETISETVNTCAAMFRALGISMQDAAQLLAKKEEE